ncbi:hypothetical protein L228DRAFT_99545 [Xylona heveae TC161]|uniref:SEC7 domain-containing protein n=1 Tax=Xylona heveae (strain CBS 132557 / TC161) TaxID=1328760 RepID=A0A161TQG9_XYLHT|nr:hypothetical protein L228DRAFT_99545 [Xylona heveae TC161]KZF24576.1 hypothetical protein L228DRAFT_99545 [Xylona heveae TC161]
MSSFDRRSSGQTHVKSRPTTPSHQGAPPETPVTKIRAGTTPKLSKDKNAAGEVNRARGARSPSASIDNVTPSPDNAADLKGRDSHDLSLSPRHVTRDSIVDHMLLSLDQISIGGGAAEVARPYPSFDRDESSVLPPRAPRRRGHTCTNSLSSDYNLFTAEGSERLTAFGSRRPRSNSSAHYPAGLDRLESVRADIQSAGGSHSRGGTGKKSSNGSGSSSVEFGYAQTYGSNRWVYSLDHRLDDRLVHSSPTNLSTMPEADLSHLYTSYDDYDAAPTPTVPAGPRRNQSSPSPSIHNSQTAHHGGLPAPLFMRSDSRPASGSGHNVRRPAPLGHAALREGFGGFNDELMVPTVLDPPAPSPTISFHKQSPVAVPPASTPPAKSRPGFFRRVFGSSKTSPLQRNMSAPQLPPVGLLSQSRSRPGSQGKVESPASQPSPAPRAISDENTPITARTQPSTLNKKPSSFFRRRKRSISVQNAPPVVPSLLQPPSFTDQAIPDPSPVSSLRTAMNPYLRGDDQRAGKKPEAKVENATVNDKEEEEEDRPRGFSPGYQPHKNATIRAVKSAEEEGDDVATPSRRKEKRSPLPNFDNAPRSRSSDNGTHGRSKPEVYEGSFLHDNSEEEEDEEHDDDHPHHLDRSAGPDAVKTSAGPTPVMSENQAAGSRQKSKLGDLVPQPSLLVPDAGMQKSQSDSALSIGANNRTGSGERKKQTIGSDRSSPTPQDGRLTPHSGLSLPLEGPTLSTKASVSSISDYKSAASLPIVQIDDEEIIKQESTTTKDATEQKKEITEEDRERAQDIFDGGERFVSKVQAAGWLGDATLVSERTRIAFMELFDWSSMSILFSMRSLCSKLVLRGETQQVDRILDAFASRWCECNPNHGFKAKDVVHTIAYSLLLLNTDLHLADIESKMTRNQFIKNTVPTVRRVALDSAPGEVETIRASTTPSRGPIPWVEPGSLGERASTLPPETKERRPSNEGTRPTQTLLKRFSQASGQDEVFGERPFDECGPLVNKPFTGSEKAWEFLIEAILRACYNSIRQNRLPLHGVIGERGTESQTSSSNNLSVNTHGVLRRSPSTISKAPSENFSFRGRPMDSRSTTGRLTSKTRSRPRIYHHSTVSSSRTSLDDQSSVFSPSTSSSTWSKYSLGKVNSAYSVDTFVSGQLPGDYKQSIGFANALSQAIIREETAYSGGSEESIRPLLEDETLELAGAPWAKEGIIKHKHHLDAADKKSKDRTWTECFAVVEKGWMRLFSFHAKSASTRNKNRNRPAVGGVVGGGNWSENAEDLGSFMLRHTIASALPPPGYSKSRPHVWALSLPSGAVHFFQVGTPEIVKEFVSTANYWSARLSKEPVMGGISNVEYGWSDAVINPALIGLDGSSGVPAAGPPAPAATAGSRPSLQSSIRSSIDHGPLSRARLPGDRVMISDWTPPQQSMMASVLLEEDQLSSLKAYVKNVETELQKHNELRSPLLLAFSPRHPNATKALANWERKSSYLLKEIVKFRTYIDSLNHAQTQKAQVYASRPESSAGKETVPVQEEHQGKCDEEVKAADEGADPKVMHGQTVEKE